MDVLAILTAATKALGELGTTGAVRERMALVVDQLNLALVEVVNLRKENQRLVEKLQEAETQLQAYARTHQFVEHHGALFKFNLSDGYEPVVYCPICEHSTSPFAGHDRFRCGTGHWTSPFTQAELPAIMAKLPGRSTARLV